MATPLPVMRNFYQDVLGLPVTGHGRDEITIQSGTMRITFAGASPDVGRPFYHLAFNIPDSKLFEASEIAIVVDDVPAVARDIKRSFSLSRYWQASDEFEALGDEAG